MLALFDTSAMSDNDDSKRTVKINDFKASEEWHHALKMAAQEDERTIAEEILALVTLGLKVRQRLKDTEDQMVTEAASEVATKDPPKNRHKGTG